MLTKRYNGRAKPAERHFRKDTRELDTRPKFNGAHCGCRPNAKSKDIAGEAVPLATFVEVFEACTAEQNARTGRRTEMYCGVKSLDQAFGESANQRPWRVLRCSRGSLCGLWSDWRHPTARARSADGITVRALEDGRP